MRLQIHGDSDRQVYEVTSASVANKTLTLRVADGKTYQIKRDDAQHLFNTLVANGCITLSELPEENNVNKYMLETELDDYVNWFYVLQHKDLEELIRSNEDCFKALTFRDADLFATLPRANMIFMSQYYNTSKDAMCEGSRSIAYKIAKLSERLPEHIIEEIKKGVPELYEALVAKDIDRLSKLPYNLLWTVKYFCNK